MELLRNGIRCDLLKTLDDLLILAVKIRGIVKLYVLSNISLTVWVIIKKS